MLVCVYVNVYVCAVWWVSAGLLLHHCCTQSRTHRQVLCVREGVTEAHTGYEHVRQVCPVSDDLTAQQCSRMVCFKWPLRCNSPVAHHLVTVQSVHTPTGHRQRSTNAQQNN